MRCAPDIPDRIRAKLNEFVRLEGGWDGEDAEPIPASIIEATRELLTYLFQAQESLREPIVLPTFDGSVQLEWHDQDHSLELGFTGAKWIALGVDLTPDGIPQRRTATITGRKDYHVASNCYEWFVRRDAGRMAWPSR